ncbi:unnamed protein product [Urochloa decumbens]|uniref:Uncharacterized protein n=1 Tax=Urochloa decumbens TaxID=240449 RepID=A0ABC8YTD1_9POAL
MPTTTLTSLEDSVESTLSTLGEQGQRFRPAQPFTIFRVPAYVRDANRSAYEPRMVSIGPYYHGAPALRATEDHKWRYLHDLLSRNSAVSSSVLIQAMRPLEARARACYSEQPLLGSDDFVRMLLLDGCFILEFFFKWHTREPDPLCDVGWGLKLLRSDLLLLENQLPFFVVEKVYDVVAGVQGSRSRELLVNLFLEYTSDVEPIVRPSSTSEIHHLLHLYYESFVPKLPEEASSSSARVREKMIPRATEMSAAGVTFVRRRRAQHNYDVAFDRRTGVMEIPHVLIDEKRPLLMNLMALEQSHQGPEGARVLTSYVSLMGMLVRTAEDVELLHRCGVLDNLLADDQEATWFFGNLGDGGAMDYSRLVFAGLCEDVQRYCGSWWHRNRAKLRQDYFGSPWSAISFFIAGLVVALAATQTYFAAFPRK